MPENKETDKGLSEQQLDDLSVDRQRERLERSRQQPGNAQSAEQQNRQQTEQKDRR